MDDNEQWIGQNEVRSRRSWPNESYYPNICLEERRSTQSEWIQIYWWASMSHIMFNLMGEEMEITCLRVMQFC
jgi:hypothetical protein